MRILVTTPDLKKPGGVAYYYATLKGRFNCDVEYFTIGTRIIGEKSLRKLFRFIEDYCRFYRRLRSGRHDLVHLNPSIRPKAFLRDAVLLGMAKLAGKRAVVHFRGWRWDWWNIYRRYFRFVVTCVYFRADVFIVQSEAFKNSLRELGCNRPIYVEPTVVSDEVICLAEKVMRERSSTISATRFNILFLSRIEKTKGIFESIESFRILKERHPSVTMTVAGSGSELETVKAYVRSHGIEDVRFLGWVSGEAKHEAFASANVYLFPTRWGEGMPNSVLEAMAYGLPIVACPVGGIADLFEKGSIGFMTDDADPGVIASLLEKLVVDPVLQHTIAEHNLVFARENFSASRVIQRLEEIYRIVLSENPTSTTGVDNRGSVTAV